MWSPDLLRDCTTTCDKTKKEVLQEERERAACLMQADDNGVEP